MKVASIALDLKLDKLFDYSIPDHLIGSIDIGSLVEIPVRGALKTGTVISLKKESNFHTLKPIAKLVNEKPVLQPDLLKLALWMSEFYCTPLGDVLKCVIPSTVRNKTAAKEQFFIMREVSKEELIEALPLIRKRAPLQAEVIDCMLKAEKGMLLTELVEKSGASRQSVHALIEKGLLVQSKMTIERSPLENAEFLPSKPKALTDEQKLALKPVIEDLSTNAFKVHLLHGVTGSGKTEIYLQAIDHALSLGKGAVVMVPEIALTTQTIERFRSRFEGKIALIHHRLSEGERLDEWEKIRSGRAQIVIGARSAIFSPLPNLGLVIVDEEHESSYKQTDSMPSYHARDVAVMRGKFANAVILLGSATPSLESYYNCQQGKYTLSTLKERPGNAILPEVKLIDMRVEFEKKKGLTIFSEALLNGIEQRIKKGEQSLLFLNRRGYHTSMLCLACGEKVKCPACDVTLSFHKKETLLACHLCGYNRQPPTSCPACEGPEPLKFRGIGTEQVESALYAIFPEIRILRLDADTTKHKGSHQKLYKAFRTGKADLLIGTQMIAKGLHFPEVTLVGILNSDAALQIPDFRASETAFQLMTQVAGRAGRGVNKGEVLIQTCMPDNQVIQQASMQNVSGFIQEELEIRKLFAYPPFAHLIKLRFSGLDLALVRDTAENMRLALEREGGHISPVSPCGHAKIKEQYRMHCFLKGEKIGPLLHILKKVRERFKIHRSVRLFIDVNPFSTFF
jgi:primosomal protein N' (replication factor Y)